MGSTQDNPYGMPERDNGVYPLTLRTAGDVVARALVTALRAHGVTLEWRAFLPDPYADPRRVASLSWDGSLVALVALVVPSTAPPGVGAALVAALYPGLPLDVPVDVPATLQLTAAGTSMSMTTRTAPELMEALDSVTERLATMARPARFADRERHATYMNGRWFSE